MSLSPSPNFPPPYTKPNNNNCSGSDIVQLRDSTNITESNIPRPNILNKQQQNNRNHQQYHRNICQICGNKNSPSNTRDIGPYLIHRTKPDLILVCPCLHRAHPVCLKNYGTDYICNMCNYIYQSRRYIVIFAQLLCIVCHLLSLTAAIGLVFGLSHLGRALDEIGLGNEIGPKLDGDETWQDHEMTQIVEWLNIVHYATGFAGEALLGLVYIVGVYLVIGVDRTLVMVSNILYIQLDWKQKPKWINRAFICTSLFVLGLILGTYLLFFSWIWASLLHHIRRRVLDVKVEKHHNHDRHQFENGSKQASTSIAQSSHAPPSIPSKFFV